ncbi:AAA family ATPase [Wolbachia endosymbiont (group A) of Ennomos erosarius]|uniref:AAA family ATPase n=1 Tax=Wolbachia endosymbiont (group A) of Ennomos erosarius TaxID=3066174 RepID=UPI003342B34F
MKSVFNRTNTPSFIAGTLATLTLLASGVFAIAPYVAFLSSIAAIGISLPVILILFALSTAVIALSYKIISQNKKLDVKEAEFSDKIKLATNTHQIKGLNMEELDKKLSIQCDKMEELRKELSTAKEELRNELSSFKTTFDKELRKELDGVAIKCEEELQMGFYEKGQEREEIITLDDVILSNDIKQKLRRICEPHALKKRQGYILCGQPGTGKTTAAKVIAYETRFTSAFISVSASNLTNTSNMRQVFEKAEKNAPCIVFIDEIDSIGAKRPNDFDDGKYSRSLNYLLEKLDGLNTMEGMTVLGATNRPGVLDSAPTRHGRLSCINFPTLEEESTCRKLIQGLNGTLKPAHLRSPKNECRNFVGLSIADMNGLIQLAIESKELLLTKFITECRNFAKSRKSMSSKQYNNMQSNNQVPTNPLLHLDEGYGSRCNSPAQVTNDSSVSRSRSSSLSSPGGSNNDQPCPSSSLSEVPPISRSQSLNSLHSDDNDIEVISKSQCR